MFRDEFFLVSRFDCLGFLVVRVCVSGIFRV